MIGIRSLNMFFLLRRSMGRAGGGDVGERGVNAQRGEEDREGRRRLREGGGD